jgi:hypothetical protein
MMNKSRHGLPPQESSLRSVLLAFLVLFLHVILILSLGSFMLLFGGVVAYLPWILAIGGILAAGSTYLWWKHMKRRGKKLRDILKDPVLQGRTVEVSWEDLRASNSATVMNHWPSDKAARIQPNKSRARVRIIPSSSPIWVVSSSKM